MNYALCIIMALGGSIFAAAQQYRVSFIRESNPWLSADNAATLTLLNVQNASEAQLVFNAYNADFNGIHNPKSAKSLCADVESYRRILPRMTAYGRISYTNTAQHDVAGSAFINNTHMPFDIVEDSLTNVGDAHRNEYNIVGALSYDVCQQLSLGAKVDFTASDYAKYKDLRHKNSLTDITATMGIFSPLTSFLQIGGNVFYRRIVEGVTFCIYGSEDKVYRSLIDYGILTGHVETFGENGYTEKNTEQPFFSEQKGFSVQLGAGNPTLSSGKIWMGAEFSFRHRTGYYGRDTEYSIVHSRHDGDIYRTNATLSFRHQSDIHQMLFSLDIENLQNDASTYTTIQDDKTSAHYYQYFTPVKMSNKLWANCSIGYRGFIGIKDGIPTWTINTKIEKSNRKQTIYYYPYSLSQNLKAQTLSASLLRNIAIRNATLSLYGAFAYRWGSGDIFTPSTIEASATGNIREPESMPFYQQRDFDSFVDRQVTTDIYARYALPIPSARLTAYAQAEWQKGKCQRTINFTLGSYF